MAHILTIIEDTVFFIASVAFFLFQNQVQPDPEHKDLEDTREDKNGVWDKRVLFSPRNCFQQV